MNRLALFFDRPYIDAHFCFTELCRHLVESGYLVDLYYLQNPYNTPPVFFDDRIRLFPFPVSAFQNVEFWLKNILSSDRRYAALIGTPIRGAWLACKLARIRKIPWFYLADEIFDPDVGHHQFKTWIHNKKKDISANQTATASVALGKERYVYQKRINALPDTHQYFILPNSQSGEATRLKSNYFRDIFNIEDNYPVILFIGTLDWYLSKVILEQTMNYSSKKYHIVFHGRSIGSLGRLPRHPFVKFSTTPLPSYLLNYAVSSADAGLVLYDKTKPVDKENGLTGGKISVYFKNMLPVIAGNLEQFKEFEKNKLGIFWNGKEDIDEAIQKLLDNRHEFTKNIPAYYSKYLDYRIFYTEFEKFLKMKINQI